MNGVIAKVRCFLMGEDGPTAVEYAVMLAMIISVCFLAIQNLGTTVTGPFSSASSAFNGSGS